MRLVTVFSLIWLLVDYKNIEIRVLLTGTENFDADLFLWLK